MKKVLVAILDWGLGHATRCIPVIRELQLQGCEVSLGGSGDALRLLQKEFPDLHAYTLPGYAPRYPHGRRMISAMLAQLPHFMRTISQEHQAVEHIVRERGLELIISDNRYGCWSSRVPSVFITHQSNILMPRRFGWAQGLVRILAERMINRFDVCWIPDLPGEASLAGDLVLQSSPRVSVKKRYIGWLSRFTRRPDSVKRFDVVAILSGPEPQRTIFEKILAPQLAASKLRYRIVRGLPQDAEPLPSEHVINFLPSVELQDCIEAADVVIARSGYSTLMDLYALGKKAIFVPTPGQTEQEYLAERLAAKQIAFSMPQDAFDLETAMRAYRRYSGFEPLGPNTQVRAIIAATLEGRL